MFFVDLEPAANNKEIYKLKHIGNAIVFVEPPRRTSDFVQCHRCQEFGHTKTYCKKPFRCVKCGLDHATSACSKPNDTPPRCINCLGNHAASYKGCKVYQELVQKKSLNRHSFQKRNDSNTYTINNEQFPHLNNPNNGNTNHTNSSQTNSNVLYSNVLKNSSKSEDQNIMKKIEAMLAKQIELTTNLMNMMSLIMTKLCN